MTTRRPKREIAFDFVLEALGGMNPTIKPMFGCHAIYIEDKIVLILRRRDDHPRDNGIWLATGPQHHESLAVEFPSMRSLILFGPGPTGWQNLPEESDDFEASALRVCELVCARDPRIGKVPKSRLRKTSKKRLLNKRRKQSRSKPTPK